MKSMTFLNHKRPLLTAMVQADNPERILELSSRATEGGAEALGMQFCRLKPEYRNREVYERLFSSVAPLPVYVTNYRAGENKLLEKSDEVLAEELLELAECGATLCDVMGDMFDCQDDELARDERAIERQMRLIDELHARGAEVLMSSHVLRFTPAERVLEIALEQERRGADICKIVTGARDMAEQIENLRIVDLLKNNLRIPFLFLAGGECRILRRIGGELGCCMYLCVVEHDALATKSQPLLSDVKTIRELMCK